MKKTAGLSVLFLFLLVPVLSGQITGAVITPAGFNVGSLLTGGYSGAPETGNHVDYEWFYAPSATSIGTSSTYTVLATDQGKSIYIVASEKKDADNSVVRTFTSSSTTVNSFPLADYVGISGTPRSGMILTGTYVYSDADSDPESGTTFQWYRGTSPGGAGQSAIGLATGVSYTLTDTDIGFYIGFSVTPSSSAGSAPGSSVTSAVWIGPVLANSAPVANLVNVIGGLSVNSTLYGNYSYSDAEGDLEGTSAYIWYTATSSGGAGQTQISGANQVSYKLTNADTTKYIAFSVTPGAATGTSPGTLQLSPWRGPVTNSAPVASSLSITGSLNVNGVLTAHYTYSDTEGDIESGSLYEWSSSSSSGGTYTAIPGETSISHQITMGEQGMYFKFSVTPKAATGKITGTKVTSSSYAGPANSKPYATGVAITGSSAVGDVLTGTYTYHDADLDPEGSSLFQWYRGSDPISGATALTDTLTIYDVDKNITFKVTPVSSGAGYPNTGNTFASSSVGPVTDPSATPPVATNLCIDGTRQTGQQLTGKYEYVNGYSESGTQYLWFRNKTLLKAGTNNPDKKYTLVADDIDKDIIFAVIPKNNRNQVGDTAFTATLAVFNMTRSAFSVADSGQVLLAKPMGGVFSGPGVTNGYFYPSVAGIAGSPYTVQYTLNVGTSTTCFQKAYKSLEVKPVVVYFDSVKNVYCDNNGASTVYVRNVPKTSPLKVFSITDPNSNLSQVNDTTAVFYPDLMNSGDKADTIYYFYLDGTSFIPVKRPLVIDHIGVVSIRNLNPGSQICSNQTPFELFTSHPGGVFTGPVLAGKLDPSLVTHMGDTIVTYKYTSGKGCSQKVIVPITVNKAPDVGFAPADSCILNSSDSTKFLNTTISPDPVKTWMWEFSESGNNSTSNKQEPSYLYKSGGYHKIILTATTINDCTSSKDITIDLGVKPVARFTWENECFHTGDSIFFFDNTISSSKIISRSWNFFDSDSLHTVINPAYPQKSTGYLNVRYIVRTAYRGCHDTLFRKIYIRPTIVLSKDNFYFENFESGNGGWVKDYRSDNTWTFGKPDRNIINRAASGDSAWFTRYNILKQDTASYSVISPCFDFRAVERPMIRMQLWKRFDRNRDGAALQYKIGDSGTWEYIGTLEDGINWFNSALIKGRPGGDLLGWTTLTSSETNWSESRHKLDDLVGKKDIKFRIAYGSDGTSQDNDGIAFDDIWIGERVRNVLLEHFENTSIKVSSTATALVDTIAAHSKKDVINIQYHTNFPAADPYYNDNPADVSARILYYGLTRAPYSFIDGGFDKNVYANLYDYSLADIDSLDIIRRSLTSPVFTIALTSDISGGILTVGGKITALGDVNAENMTLYIAVTEKKNTDHTGANGETVFLNVFRKLIPDAGGLTLKKTWTKGDELTIPDQTWVIEKIKKSADIEVIAFLQNNITKEIYQASSQLKLNIVTGIESLFGANGKGFSLYPNPSVNKLTIEFNEPPAREADIRIYDMQGIIVKSFKAGQGISGFTIENLGLKAGIYLVRISSGNTEIGFRKLIVSGN